MKRALIGGFNVPVYPLCCIYFSWNSSYGC